MENRVALKVEKCLLGVSELEFDGHITSSAGVQLIFSNVDGIVEVPIPTNETAIKSFLGAVAYYSKFIPAYSETIEPLRYLLSSKKYLWNWTPDYAIFTLKQRPTSPFVITYFCDDKKSYYRCFSYIY